MKPYYEHAGIVIYHGDCREILPQLSECDAVITDPPYGVGFNGKRTKRAASLVNTGYESNFVDDVEYIEHIVIPVIQTCRQRFKRVVVTCGTRCMFRYPEPDDIGCVFNPAGAGRSSWGFNCFNPILYYGKEPYLANGLGARPNGFMEVAAGDGNNGHPCPKPVRWMRWLVKKASLIHEMVLDPFCGSGTTLEAAKDLHRRAIGIEIHEKYCEIAAQRLSQEVFQFEEAI